ncbi:PPK2 family polyphosphate kinase [Peptoniphilus harei]|jgi:polyphosphate:nucleotide phosphotransferase, PPK2 family|uniref:Polyphosphate--nucleotide phosphotransferase n=1 Tax=Peptoniphilus harei TaxID=54005 RepID=A0A943SPC4_9FIRM|nr:PPK2 family polyphosphate kinase [Peptoniphilus harei]MBS6534666.1 polyphosphate--nucleotide phosphotransferase [Peptoniphilus harei]
MINKYKISGEKIKIENLEEKIVSKEKDDEIKRELYEDLVPRLRGLHEKLFAESKQGILVVLQAIDAAGKDEIIKYIFSNLEPQGLKNTSYGKPTDEENAHDYLWRMAKGLPKRGEVAILNRSYYEDIISPKIYDTLGHLPDEIKNDENLWEKRYKHINNFEEYLVENGFKVVKFFFNVSKDEQRKRLLERIEDPKKNADFSFSDLDDRDNWDKYQIAFEEMLNNTSTETAPWYVLPADNPWLARKIATLALIETMEEINPKYPTFTGEDKEKAKEIADKLRNKEI